MKEAIEKLTREQIEFILDECGITEDELDSMDEDQLYDNVYDRMCDIELEEIPSGNEEESERCKMASELVTILGDTLD